MPSNLLSKSKYITGLQCPRLIWTQFHEPEKLPETDPVTQHIFDQGHLVGELAKKLFPEGIDISTEDFMGNISNTMNLLKKRKPLFEAGILAGNLYSRVDILHPVAEEEWDIVEVKSSTSLKDVHISDVAYQRYLILCPHAVSRAWQIVADVSYCHIRSFMTESQGMRGTQTMRCPSDNGYLAFKSGCHTIPPFAYFGALFSSSEKDSRIA